MATTISNGESGSSVRAKLNDIWDGLELNEIAASKADTAVDVFVYDTSKDSDGGAWRKRTQATSWYNETLNTATRGSRREFPAVAVIVAEAYTVTIYDGDDPDLPMWMVFEAEINDLIVATTSYPFTGVSMLNGELAVSHNNYGLFRVNFALDAGECHRASNAFTYAGEYKGSIAQRNDGLGFSANHLSSDFIVSNTVNDVAMTVLPNAPIDPATRLPVPTIAVATAGGVSVIKDDGTVVDAVSTDVYKGVSFVKSQYGSDLYAVNTTFADDPQWYSNVGGLSDGFTFTKNFYANSPTYEKLSSDTLSQQSGNVFAPIAEHTFAVGMATSADIGLDPALNLVKHSTTLDRDGLVAFINSSHNTGWMNGDIKLATLSDTDDTDVTGSELVTNGTFDTDTSGWSSGNGTIAVASGKLQITSGGSGNGYAYQAITTEVGKVYVVSADYTDDTGTNALMWVGTTVGGGQTATTTFTTTGSYNLTFTATATTHYIRVGANEPTASLVYLFDNISVRLAEEDRSVNGNGLQVFGTVTKNPVATGADLVAYSNFGGATNYLSQPYNSDLDFGTGDFCIMGWFKGTDPYGVFCGTNTVFGNGFQTAVTGNAGSATYLFVAGSANTASSVSSTIESNTWVHVVFKRQNGVAYIYENSSLIQTSANAGNVANGDTLAFGYRQYDNAMNYQGSLALWRISATAPTAEQIKKIYEDEKVLFQEGAQATLYGASDAVTALAHDSDTGLLHVGTSAGRSVFQGLRRVSNTTTAVGTAISASNGLVVEE